MFVSKSISYPSHTKLSGRSSGAMRDRRAESLDSPSFLFTEARSGGRLDVVVFPYSFDPVCSGVVEYHFSYGFTHEI